jgi:hypothetical protein
MCENIPFNVFCFAITTQQTTHPSLKPSPHKPLIDVEKKKHACSRARLMKNKSPLLDEKKLVLLDELKKLTLLDK